MFQPQPTPYASFAAYAVAGELPGYAYQQVPVSLAGHHHEFGPELGEEHGHGLGLGLGHGGGVGAGGGAGGAAAGVAAPAPQLPLDVLTSPAFATSPLLHTFHHHHHHPDLLRRMEPCNPELAAQQVAAQDYQPLLQGPLVGSITPSDAIAEEYAKADPVYIAKTIALPQVYTHYRPIQGDGNCGWRAIGFCYFETLVRCRHRPQVEGEIQRMTELNRFLAEIGGYDPFLFEDMVDETITLLRDVSVTIANTRQAMAIIEQRFNDDEASNAIIYHLRLLAASYIKGNVETYAPFTGDLGVDGYCSAWLERPGREIEHLGITLLVDMLFKPLNFELEIAYLDRTPGSQVNIYRFPEHSNTQDPANPGPVVHLLFRPDHYDILYPNPPDTTPINLQVRRITNFRHQHHITSNTPDLRTYTNVDMTPLSMVPGFGSPRETTPISVTDGSSSTGETYPTSPADQWVSLHFTEALAVQPQPALPPPQQSTMPNLRFTKFCHPNFSKYCSEHSVWQEQACTSSTFRNSHYNTAHYNNPNFQPEVYLPGPGDVLEKASRRRGHRY